MNAWKPALLALLAAAGLRAQGDPGLDPGFFDHDPRTIMVSCADKARAEHPGDSRMLADFGRIYLAAGERERALEAFRRAARIGAPGRHHAQPDRQGLAGRWSKGRGGGRSQGGGRPGPKDKALLRSLGLQFSDAGYPEEGGRFMERAYALEPSNRELAVEFGRACLRARQPDRAAVWFRRALTGAGSDVYRTVGLAYAERGARP